MKMRCYAAIPSRFWLFGLLGALGFFLLPALSAQVPEQIQGFSGEGLGLYHLGWSPEGRWAGLISYAEPPALYLVILDTVSDEVLLRSRQQGWKKEAVASFWKSRIASLYEEVEGYGVETGQKVDVREPEFLTGGIRYRFAMSPTSPAAAPYSLEFHSGLKGRKTVYDGRKNNVGEAVLLGCLVSPFESRAMAVVREKGVLEGRNYRFVGANLLIGFQAVRDHPKKEEKQSMDLVSPVLNGQAEILKLRLAAGADANQEDARGFAVVVIAARLGHWEIMRGLLEAGANPNARDSDGRTALHYAAFFDREAALQALLDSGADKNLRDAAGRRPGDFATGSAIRALLE